MTYQMMDRKINKTNQWRSTTYEREDGSRFNVGLPPERMIDGIRFYNEDKENEVAERMNSIARVPKEEMGT